MTTRSKIINALKMHKSGLTYKSLAILAKTTPKTISARISEMKREGMVVKSRHPYNGFSGRPTTVWVLSDHYLNQHVHETMTLGAPTQYTIRKERTLLFRILRFLRLM